MIQKQFYRTRKDGVNLYITFSDEGLLIKKKSINNENNTTYRIAVDVESSSFEYIEIDEPIKFNKKERLMLEKLGRKYLLPNDELNLE